MPKTSHWRVQQGGGTIRAMLPNGTVSTFTFQGSQSPDAPRPDAAALSEAMTRAGAVLLGGLPADETGYWNPAVTTGADGRATLTVTLPDRSTAWTLVAKGITAETLAGEASENLATRKDLFGELKLPLAFTLGDKARIGATIHNDALDKGRIEVVLKTTLGGRSTEEHRALDVTARGLHELSFETLLAPPADAARPGDSGQAVFELTVTAGPRRDHLRRAVPLQPYGMPVYATAGGTAASDTTAWVELPAEMPASGPAWRSSSGPTSAAVCWTSC